MQDAQRLSAGVEGGEVVNSDLVMRQGVGFLRGEPSGFANAQATRSSDGLGDKSVGVFNAATEAVVACACLKNTCACLRLQRVLLLVRFQRRTVEQKFRILEFLPSWTSEVA